MRHGMIRATLLWMGLISLAFTTIPALGGIPAPPQSTVTVPAGTGVGAIVGRTAGGGTGAAIGAVSGAALGTTVAAAKGGKQVSVPSESLLEFQLEQPASLPVP